VAAAALSWAARAAEPPCAVSDRGYVDPNVTLVNGNIENADAQACQDKCVALVTCRVFTFYVNSGGCWLQGLDGVVPPLKDIPGVFSGPRDCPAGTGVAGLDGGAAVPGSAQASSESAGAGAAGAAAAGDGAGGTAPAEVFGQTKWTWTLLFAVLAILAVSTYWFGCRDGGSRKVKRDRKRAMIAEVENPPSAKMMSATDALPDASAASAVQAPLLLSQRPLPTHAAPIPPAPVTTAVTTAYAAPVMYHSVRAPQAAQEPVAARPPPQTLFDRLDTNHDGVLTREELTALAASNAMAG